MGSPAKRVFALLSLLLLNLQVAIAGCSSDNCFRALEVNSAGAAVFCKLYTKIPIYLPPLPTYLSPCNNLPSRISSACSCMMTTSMSSTKSTSTTSSLHTTSSSSHSKSSASSTTAASSTISTSLTSSIPSRTTYSIITSTVSSLTSLSTTSVKPSTITASGANSSCSAPVTITLPQNTFMQVSTVTSVFSRTCPSLSPISTVTIFSNLTITATQPIVTTTSTISLEQLTLVTGACSSTSTPSITSTTSSSTSACSTNSPLINGGFESGSLSPWTFSTSGGEFMNGQEVFTDGTYNIQNYPAIGGAMPYGDSYLSVKNEGVITQNITLCAGHIYYATAYVALTSPPPLQEPYGGSGIMATASLIDPNGNIIYPQQGESAGSSYEFWPITAVISTDDAQDPNYQFLDFFFPTVCRGPEGTFQLVWEFFEEAYSGVTVTDFEIHIDDLDFQRLEYNEGCDCISDESG